MNEDSPSPVSGPQGVSDSFGEAEKLEDLKKPQRALEVFSLLLQEIVLFVVLRQITKKYECTA